MNSIDITTLSRDERSVLLYAETCMVDRNGLLEGMRMNEADIAALKKFQGAGALEFGRIPFKIIGTLIHPHNGGQYTHWVTFHEPAWQAAHALRRVRSQGNSSNRNKVDAALAERVVA